MSVRNVAIEIDPVTIKTSDGQTRSFFLTRGGTNRVMRLLGVKTRKELYALDTGEVVDPILYEALHDKENLTFEQFQDILPDNPVQLLTAVALLLGDKLDPLKAVAEVATTAEVQTQSQLPN